ncbi:MAG: hypothetical protein HZA92_14150 [Verrucomicrobia bacterium]|nr:hypothetical protein [Verrucomicrobiota bacterium]
MAQVIFINVDDIPPAASSNLPATASNSTPVHLHVAVVRFLPAKAGQSAPDFAGGTTLAAVVATLAKQGQVNLLFSGDRVTPGGAAHPATFDSVERRPAFFTKAEANQTLTNREFGLRLTLTAIPLADGRIELDWQGRFMWSSDLLNAWAGEKYLVFGMKVAQFARPGLFYYQSDDPDEDEPAGINLRALFGKKKKAEPPPKSAVPDISFLSLEDREIPLSGQRPVKSGELVVISTPTNRDLKQPEFIYMLLRFTEAD